MLTPKKAMNRHLFRHHRESCPEPTLQQKIRFHDGLHDGECTHTHEPRNQQHIVEYAHRLLREGES
jgi:hypothetical protein